MSIPRTCSRLPSRLSNSTTVMPPNTTAVAHATYNGEPVDTGVTFS